MNFCWVKSHKTTSHNIGLPCFFFSLIIYSHQPHFHQQKDWLLRKVCIDWFKRGQSISSWLMLSGCHFEFLNLTLTLIGLGGQLSSTVGKSQFPQERNIWWTSEQSVNSSLSVVVLYKTPRALYIYQFNHGGLTMFKNNFSQLAKLKFLLILNNFWQNFIFSKKSQGVDVKASWVIFIYITKLLPLKEWNLQNPLEKIQNYWA